MRIYPWLDVDQSKPLGQIPPPGHEEDKSTSGEYVCGGVCGGVCVSVCVLIMDTCYVYADVIMAVPCNLLSKYQG